MPPSLRSRLDPAQLRLLVFDLDGTLIDSRADLVASVNAMLEQLGRPPLPADIVSHYVGDGAALLVQRALGLAPPRPALPETPADTPPESTAAPLAPPDPSLADHALRLFLAHYARHKLDHTTLYPGVAAGLAALAAAGYRMAVLTNKPVRPSRDIVRALGLADFFSAVHGGDSFAEKKPHPMGLFALLADAALPPAAALMVGDTQIDIRVGKNAGCWTCGLTYGFAPASLAAPAPDWLLDAFPQLPQRLLSPGGGPAA